ncbi:hypothetical protein CHUAL_001512 [Chamberlinius hualienensis]
MSLDRRLSKSRVCRKYRPYLCIAIVILTFQVILAFCVYRINHSESAISPKDWKFDRSEKEIGPLNKYGIIDEYATELEAHNNEKFLSRVKVLPRSKKQYEEEIHFLESSAKQHLVSNRPSSNITIAHEVAVKLNEVSSVNISELGIQLNCDIISKDAMNCIKRAKTLDCKLRIANISCLYQERKLIPSQLPRYCKTHGVKKGDYLGCFGDKGTIRILPNLLGSYTNATSDKCIDMCLQTGYRYAGVKYGIECYCGDDYPAAEFEQSATKCNTACLGSKSLHCGGRYSISIYHTGLKKNLPILSVTSDLEDKPVKVLFMLTINGRAVRQVHRLIKALYHVDSYFYIHVDARQEYLYNELLPLEKQFLNIKLARKRHATIWGGASLLEMLLNSMKAALSFENWHWDFFINLSETDFPVKTHDELIKYLTKNKNKNFLKSHGRATEQFIAKQGLDQTFFECDYHMWRIGSRELPRGIRVDGGSDWVVLNREFCKYVTHSNNELVTGLKEVYKYTLLGAESFFHTVLRNSEMCNTFMDNNLHITNWQREIGCRCQYKHVVDWCGCSPNAFKPKDWQRLKNSRGNPLYFARKFEPIINQVIIDQLENWLFGPRPENQLGLTSYWQNEYHCNVSSPQPDDAFLSAYHSFSRLSVTLLDDLTAHCQLTAGKVLEATLYNENDAFKGTIITFESTVKYELSSELVELETQVRPSIVFQSFDLVGPSKRLKRLEVSTNYDHKERLLRNFGKILGPFSEPCLLHEWNEGEEFAATFVWIDPANAVAGSFEVKVDTSAHINFHKPTFQTPLRPGIWTLKFMHQWKTMAETKFVVLPMNFYNGYPITIEQTKLVNGGPGKSYMNHNFENVEKLLGYFDKRQTLQNSWISSQKTGKRLREWTDKLVSMYFSVQDTCYVNASFGALSTACLQSLLDPCENVPWSTKYPDPKSKIEEIDPMTGLLKR